MIWIPAVTLLKSALDSRIIKNAYLIELRAVILFILIYLFLSLKHSPC